MQPIKGGYVLQPRIFDSSDASKMSPITRELWFYLLRNVNYSDNKNIKRGQGFFQFSDIQEALHWYVGYRKMVYSKPQITKALRRLCEGNMTATMKATRGIIITVCNYEFYQDPKNYEGNDEGSTKDQRRDLGGHTIHKKVKKEKKEKGIYSRVTKYLNAKTGKKYREDSKVMVKLLGLRLKDGFSPEDFKTVIDNKTAQWLNDPENEKYLRPETLFGSKFESYLNEKPVNGTKLSEKEVLEKHGL